MSRDKSSRKIIIILSSVGIFVALGSFVALSYFDKIPNVSQNIGNNAQKLSVQATAAPTLSPDTTQALPKEDNADMISKVLPSVVGVSAEQISKDDLFNPSVDSKMSVGSGVILTENGYIVTNHHVLGNVSESIKISLSDGKVYLADLKWSDATLDLAVIKIEQTGLTPAKMGDAKLCRVGQTAIAIGNPLGLQFQRTVTKGVISAMNRTITTQSASGETQYMEDLLQTDASINPGNSGGPLINEKGEVLGINTVKISSAEGIGFAVPINVIKPVIKAFQDTGEFRAPYFGIFAYDNPVADYINQNFDNKMGVHIVTVDAKSPAYKIGLRPNDIITHINRKQINTMMEFREEIYSWNSSNPISITFISNGAIKEAMIKLD